ncbi:hypothetical protein IEO21_05434 [Rhodonia placenta]|uniref:BTB domain-containing protein n=1 Tax=Rhodonia placenta TaxID=104341 RepID=A0A8H7P255_9APHY|nr:hypothetical protein IEO21_05434 [Postia placenta]
MEPKTALSPFDKDDADVILRSSDNVDFHVYKVVLRMVSGIFHDLFSIPQPLHPHPNDIHPERGIPLIPVPEDGKTLDCLLRLCYPTPDPEAVDDVDLLAAVFTAARKYDMEDAASRMKKSILQLGTDASLHERTIRIYAKAIQLGLEDVAHAAAHASTSWQTFNYVAELDNITAGALYRLLRFRRMHPERPQSFTFCHPGPDERPGTASVGVSTAESPASPKPVVASAIFNHPSADIIIRSSDNVDLRLSRTILTIASSVLAEMLSQPSFALTTTSLPESGRILHMLFQVAYPMEDPRVSDLDEAIALHDTAEKYKMSFAMDFARRAFLQCTHANPLRAYFIAMQRKWTPEARQAASQALFLQSDPWVPEMETSPASVYHQFLDYRTVYHKLVYEGSRRRMLFASQSKMQKAQHWSDLRLDKGDKSGYMADRLLTDIHTKVMPDLPAKGVEGVLAIAYSKELDSDGSMREKLLDADEKLATRLRDACNKVRIHPSTCRTHSIEQDASRYVHNACLTGVVSLAFIVTQTRRACSCRGPFHRGVSAAQCIHGRTIIKCFLLLRRVHLPQGHGAYR